MTYPEQWSTDPGENTKQPPVGAPENGLPGDKISDTFRVVMAGIRECWNRVGTLGLQNKDNVDLTGGRIRAGVTIEGTVTTSGTATNSLALQGQSLTQVLQGAYNVCWPVGSLRWLLPSQAASILVPAGIVATWAEQTGLADRLLAIKGPELADTWGGTGTALSVAISNTALSIAQMPLHGHPTLVSQGIAGSADDIGGIMLNNNLSSVFAPYTGTPDFDTGQQIGGQGGSQPHTHTATVTLPKGASLRLYRRTA